MAIFNGKKLPKATYNGARLLTVISPAGGGGNVEIYSGEYEVTPSTEKQSLDTDGKMLVEDVTVNEIPRADVSNTDGGTTVTIG